MQYKFFSFEEFIILIVSFSTCCFSLIFGALLHFTNLPILFIQVSESVSTCVITIKINMHGMIRSQQYLGQENKVTALTSRVIRSKGKYSEFLFNFFKIVMLPIFLTG